MGVNFGRGSVRARIFFLAVKKLAVEVFAVPETGGLELYLPSSGGAHFVLFDEVTDLGLRASQVAFGLEIT